MADGSVVPLYSLAGLLRCLMDVDPRSLGARDLPPVPRLLLMPASCAAKQKPSRVDNFEPGLLTF